VKCWMWGSKAPEALQALRSLPQSITWRPFCLRLKKSQSQSTMLELLAAFAATPLAQAVSELTLYDWHIEPPIAALRALFINVLHFELWGCNQFTASSCSEALAAWPMLRSMSINANYSAHLAAQQPLVAAAHTAAELKAGQPLQIVLTDCAAGEGSAARMDALVAAIHNAGGGKVDVRWVRR